MFWSSFGPWIFCLKGRLGASFLLWAPIGAVDFLLEGAFGGLIFCFGAPWGCGFFARRGVWGPHFLLWGLLGPWISCLKGRLGASFFALGLLGVVDVSLEEPFGGRIL